MATASLQAETTSTESEAISRDILVVPSSPFFVRSLELPAGIRREEIESFVEVTLEEISPFGLNQVFWGYYLPPDSERVLIYSAYRKNLEREAAEDSWEEATLVLPGFAAALGVPREERRVVLLESSNEVTAVYWSARGKVPDAVASRRFNGEEGVSLDDARRQVLQRAGVPEATPATTLEAPETAAFRNKAVAFDLRQPGGAEGPTAELPRTVVWPLDIRDKDFLVTKRKQLRQNRWLWNAVVLFLVSFGLLAILEIGLFAGGRVLETRAQRVEEIAPVVAKIQEQAELADLLEDLGEQRMLPFEMLDYLNRLRPRSVYFDRVSTVGTRGLEAESITTNSADVSRYVNLLNDSPAIARADIQNLRSRDGGRSTFTLAVQFREGEIPSGTSRTGERPPADEESPPPGEESAPPGEEGGQSPVLNEPQTPDTSGEEGPAI